MRESIDIRNYLFTKDSLLGALFPNVKGFKADGKTSRTKTSPTSLGAASASAELSDAKLDVISQNTKIAAKNSMVMPSMARDMNVMRQNIVKMVKLSGGKASTKADMFFTKASEREKAYESQIQTSKSPSSVSSVTDTTTSESGGGGFKGFLKTLVGGLLLALGVAVFKYFTDPQFKNTIDEKIITPLKENFVDPLMNMFKELAGEFLLVAGAIAALKLAFTGISASTIIGAIGRLALNPYVIAAGVAAYMINKGRNEAEEMVGLNERFNKSLSDPNAPKLTPEEEKRREELNQKTDFSRQTEQLESMMEVSDEPSAAAKAIKRFFRFGVGEGDAALKTPPAAASAPTPMPPPVGMEAGRGTNRAPTPAPAQSTTISDELLSYIKSKEGFRANAYWDHKQYSIGYGTKANGSNEVIDEAEAERRLIRDLEARRNKIIEFGNRHNYNWTDKQLDALTSFAHNVGSIDQLTQGGTRSNEEIAQMMTKYVQASGKTEPGLVRRRQEEVAMFNSQPGSQSGTMLAGLGGQTSRPSGAGIASASTAVDSARLDASNPMSLIPALMSMATPKTPSIPAQQINIPSTMDSDLFDALVARATEFA
jgi:GH24 family phage-related lysozyme (muramidase)